MTKFLIPAGKVYLSPVIDCYDGLPVAWNISCKPNAQLVNTMLDRAIHSLPQDAHPILHSDRGCHYRWPGWIKRVEDAGLIRSMSSKECSPDNSACEGFFGRMENEMFYGRSWQGVTLENFMRHIEEYMVCNRSIIPRYRKVVVLGTHTAENHDFISSDQGSRSSISKSLLCSARSGNMLSR